MDWMEGCGDDAAGLPCDGIDGPGPGADCLDKEEDERVPEPFRVGVWTGMDLDLE